jgi:anti-sigma factor ChrR (cupin superfamily)
MSEPLHGDLEVRVAVDPDGMAWTPSPSGSVWRKRLHRVGPEESGQVTSIVRYEPGSRFPAHDHPEGEEILVLEGVFSDEHGDWPAGTYLLNPEGFRHAPFSRQGCLLFVKLRQYAGAGRRHVAIDTGALPWTPTRAAGIALRALYAQPGFADSMRLERWEPGAALDAPVAYPEGVEILVLEGRLEDDEGIYPTHAWLRLPAGAAHRPRSPEGCTLYVKRGGLRDLRAAT